MFTSKTREGTVTLSVLGLSANSPCKKEDRPSNMTWLFCKFIWIVMYIIVLNVVSKSWNNSWKRSPPRFLRILSHRFWGDSALVSPEIKHGRQSGVTTWAHEISYGSVFLYVTTHLRVWQHPLLLSEVLFIPWTCRLVGISHSRSMFYASSFFILPVRVDNNIAVGLDIFLWQPTIVSFITAVSTSVPCDALFKYIT